MEYDRASFSDEVERTAPGAIEELDRELERFDNSLERLTRIADPVTNRYAGVEKVLSEPQPEPATALRGRTQRLRDQLARLDRIMNEIDL